VWYGTAPLERLEVVGESEGLVAEVLHFCQCIRSGSRPEIAGSDYARDMLALYEAFQAEEGARVELG